MWTLRGWLCALSLWLPLCLTGCFGGQTGDPSGCAPPDYKPVLNRFEGVYASPVVFSAPPDECPMSPDGTLHVEIIGDVAARGGVGMSCFFLGWVAVLVRQSVDDGETTTEPGWLSPNGTVVLVEGGGFPDSGAPEQSLGLDPDRGLVWFVSEGLSTVERCCFDSEGDTCP